MKIKAHQTFSIRMGWLYKGLSNVIEDTKKSEYSNLFVSDDSMNRLGLGSNMVKSLRYWMIALGLTSEKIKSGQKATEFGNLVFKNDKHFEEIGTLLLCHYFLVTNKDWGTSWYYLFNEYDSKEFVKQDLIIELTNWIQSRGSNVARSSVTSDVECILKTYCESRIYNNDENVYEDTKICPFTQLGLITQSNQNNNVYFKKSVPVDLFPLEIAMFAILKQIETTNNNLAEINLDSLLLKANSITKVFNFSTEDLIKLISKLEMKGYLKYIKTSGLEQLKLNDKTKNSNYYLNKFFENINNEK